MADQSLKLEEKVALLNLNFRYQNNLINALQPQSVQVVPALRGVDESLRSQFELFSTRIKAQEEKLDTLLKNGLYSNQEEMKQSDVNQRKERNYSANLQSMQNAQNALNREMQSLDNELGCLSNLIKNFGQAEFLATQIPDSNKATLLYRASRDGFDASIFHSLCDNKGRTLSLVLSQSDYLSAGYSAVPWTSPEEWEKVYDPQAFVCSLTNEFRIFRPGEPERAVVHAYNTGPRFNNALNVGLFEKGICAIKGSSLDYAKYCIPADSFGNSVLTGEAKLFCGEENGFKIKDVEVFLIE